MENKRILIVEDEMIVSSSMSIQLILNGYDCMVADTGEAAIELFSSFAPHLVLMDIGLAGKIDGISTAAIIRKQAPIPIVFVTDQINRQIFKQASETQPQNYITKPFTENTLLNAVELALQQPVLVPTLSVAPPLGERVDDGIFIYATNQYIKILFKDILYLEADGAYTNMYCSEHKSYTLTISSNHVVAQLNYPGMIQTARSYHVNIHRIDSVKRDALILEDNTVPLTKDFKEDLLARIKKISHGK
jgi:two-component system, response regulator PdtaR